MAWPAKGYAHTSTDKARTAERFRHHVWSPRFPHRRIMRPWHCCHCRAKDVQVEAHHVDYSNPFLVSWLCRSCHRRVEAGSIRLGRKHLFDYSSLVRLVKTRWRCGNRGRAYGGVKVPF